MQTHADTALMPLHHISSIEMPLYKCQRAFFAQVGIGSVEVVMVLYFATSRYINVAFLKKDMTILA